MYYTMERYSPVLFLVILAVFAAAACGSQLPTSDGHISLLDIEIKGSCTNVYPPTSGYYWINGPFGPVGVFCELNPEFGESGGWVRIANVDMSEQTECPEGLELLTDPARMCRKPVESGCGSASFSTHGLTYSKVCGTVNGYQYYTTGAFYASFFGKGSTIDDYYVDGISLTHGHSPRKHIWTFASGVGEGTVESYSNCPCSSPHCLYDYILPAFIGSDYFCETGNRGLWSDTPSQWFTEDLLWDGKGCGANSTCCGGRAGKRWFCKSLPEPTTDDIEIRLCTDEERTNEDVAVAVIELYIQ